MSKKAQKLENEVGKAQQCPKGPSKYTVRLPIANKITEPNLDLKDIIKEGTKRIKHLKPMKRNFRMKSVTPTIQSTSQKFLKSTVGFKKIKL